MVIDGSGSMNGTVGVPNVIEGVDEYVKGLIEDESEADGKTLLSLTAFSGDGDDHRHVADPIREIPSIGTWYRAGGGTPLFDAIANSLYAADKKLEELGVPELKCLHVTLTDGGENASHDFPNQSVNYWDPPTNADLIALVQEYENLTAEERKSLSKSKRASLVKARIEAGEPQGNWTFVYLGAERTVEESQRVAVSMGYAAGNAMAYAATPDGAKSTMSSLRGATLHRNVSESATSGTFFADAGQSAVDYGNDVTSAENANDLSLVNDVQAPDNTVIVPKKGDVAKATGILKSSSLSDALKGK